MADSNQQKLQINLHLYDTNLTVNIDREDEKLYRDAGKLINEVVNTYAQIFKGKKSDKEILYMALVDVALRLQRESVRNDVKPYDDVLEELTAELEKELDK